MTEEKITIKKDRVGPALHAWQVTSGCLVYSLSTCSTLEDLPSFKKAVKWEIKDLETKIKNMKGLKRMLKKAKEQKGKKKEKKEKKYNIEVEVDTNDGDYATCVTTISEEVLDRLRPLFAAIKECKHGNNYPKGECARDKESYELYYPQFNVPLDPPLEGYDEETTTLDLFEDTCEPSAEHGFHTVATVSIYPEVNKERLI